ncbi:conserved hypothetical protein [Neospora caninum Liverpool]|uniref:PITH domain-containing protein n=1 Tax=Neospora caninum (strain Liverpool) TaxID=572307 RepID=F0VPV3_NEOCL|nr:conserved hypothetical protein [Neospora caninum Liverpool]CBZ55750.1 conserved hypothetical protein [Neospora caninum Liverpool]|eukprot:XP_003885776.1 conserved hypothetical protein [Neospora caninum Liverpool]
MSLIDMSKVECLNEDAQHSIRNIIEKTSDAAYLSSSNEDPQLLIKLGFTSPVKLSSLMIKSPPGSAEAGEVPTTIKLFTNNLAMGFSEAESEPPIQEVVRLRVGWLVVGDFSIHCSTLSEGDGNTSDAEYTALACLMTLQVPADTR